MKKKINIILIFMLLLANACETMDVQEPDSDLSVVEGYIEPNDTIVVAIRKQIVYADGDTTAKFIEDVTPKIYDGTDWYYLEYSDSGRYISTELNVEATKEYTLQFTYADNEVTSTTTIPTKPIGFTASTYSMAIESGHMEPGSMPDPIELSWDNEEGDYHMIVIECMSDDLEAIDDWDDDEDRPPRAFRNTPTQDDYQELDRMSFSYYGKHRVILYKLNSEYAALYEQISNNSLDITEPPSNIENGLGIFTGVNSDTLYIHITD